MYTFKVVFAALAALSMVYFLVITRRSALQRIFVLGFFGTGITFIVKPGLTNTIAHAVGIGRGADLVFYLSTLFLCCLSLNFYLRFRQLEARQTLLARELALRNPVQESDTSSSPESSARPL